MHFNPLLTTSILVLTSGAIAWTNQEPYDLYVRDIEGLYARQNANEHESLSPRDARPRFLHWDIGNLRPRDALGPAMGGINSRLNAGRSDITRYMQTTAMYSKTDYSWSYLPNTMSGDGI